MGGFFERRAMTEFRITSAPWPAKTFTATVIPADSLINVLSAAHMRLCEADELRQNGKFDRAQRICESLIREHPDYMAAYHSLRFIHFAKKHLDRFFAHQSLAVIINPRSWNALTALAEVCVKLDATDMA